MRKLSFFVFSALSVGVFTIGATCSPVKITVNAASSNAVYVGGMSAGFTLKSDGAQIVGMCEVVTESGMISPAVRAGLRAGDKIVKVNTIAVQSITQLNELINASKGRDVDLEIQRNMETMHITVKPVCDKSTGRYKIGILARDSVSGIGTVTYINKENGRFGALGHAVLGENKQELTIFDGSVYACSIVGVSKGVRGKAGELRGMFLSNQTLGVADRLCDSGIFGCISKDFQVNDLLQSVADSAGAVPGNAYIYSTVDGLQPKKYQIEIVKVDKSNRENKNYVIKITDDALVEQTGGIVQGMSGSPIMQNGKLIGAVTHVFVNDPTRGYGIDIQKMMQE